MQYGSFASFIVSNAGAAAIQGTGQIASAAIIGRSGVKTAQISADAQKYQMAASLQAQQLDNDFGKTALSYLPQLGLLAAGTLVAIVAMKTL
jgi:hypothetical protein